MRAVLVVEFRIKPSYISAFESAMAENARQSLTLEPGCLQFDVCRDAAEEGVFFLYEVYEDDAAIQAHLTSAHFLEMNGATQDWVESKSVRKLTLPDGAASM
ncbi:putative quinol monooxygenase [Alcaligenaceae bacterium C4P045]|nr:putative quinol monooxygenase [Alcaligenaceae bacterium C4P045]